jgi:cytochrome c oxidase assembly protein subunit 15
MLIQLAVIGILASLLPLTIVWGSRDANKYRKLVWVTLFLTFDLIMFGAFTRLTDSGLGCPDWPGCYGQANPFQAHADIHAAQTAMPSGPVTPMKAWIEMIHRYLAMAIGVLVIGLMASAWRRWLKSGRSDRLFSPWYPSILFGFICLQGAFGAWTVTMKLQPLIVTIHLLLGLILLALLTWLAARQSDHRPLLFADSAAATSLRIPAAAAVLMLAVQIALGAWVSTNYAALACLDFPLCNGTLFPQMDLPNGFTLWRDLGKTAGGEYLPFPALTAIHWMHRMFALAATISIGWVAYAALKIDPLHALARWLLVALALQLASGVSTIFLNWPLALAVAHNGGAALLVLLLVMLNYKLRISPGAASSRATAISSPA